ncbi:anti-sigma factor antagonist [Streptomyces sp. NPDC059070]|uniref:anti-sigma factor antagonist n=1 Tax=unclassified Streptomyces TaxID=2593676 RepID=UPI0034E28AC7
MVAPPQVSAPPPRVYRTLRHTVVELRGEIDIAVLPQSLPVVDEVTSPQAAQVVIDLTPVTFLDCSGLRLLNRARLRLAARGGSLTVVCPHPFTLRVIALSGLGRTLHVVRGLREAIDLDQCA